MQNNSPIVNSTWSLFRFPETSEQDARCQAFRWTVYQTGSYIVSLRTHYSNDPNFIRHWSYMHSLRLNNIVRLHPYELALSANVDTDVQLNFCTPEQTVLYGKLTRWPTVSGFCRRNPTRDCTMIHACIAQAVEILFIGEVTWVTPLKHRSCATEPRISRCNYIYLCFIYYIVWILYESIAHEVSRRSKNLRASLGCSVHPNSSPFHHEPFKPTYGTYHIQMISIYSLFVYTYIKTHGDRHKRENVNSVGSVLLQ